MIQECFQHSEVPSNFDVLIIILNSNIIIISRFLECPFLFRVPKTFKPIAFEYHLEIYKAGQGYDWEKWHVYIYFIQSDTEQV